jgi:hypothetical protein
MRSSCRVSNSCRVGKQARAGCGLTHAHDGISDSSCGKVAFKWDGQSFLGLRGSETYVVRTVQGHNLAHRPADHSPPAPRSGPSRDEASRDQGTEALLLSGTLLWGSHGPKSLLRKKHQAEQRWISSSFFPIALSNSHVGSPSLSSNHVNAMAPVQ